LFELFGVFELTIVVVKGREVDCLILLSPAVIEMVVANAASAVEFCNKGLVSACSKLRVESVYKT